MLQYTIYAMDRIENNTLSKGKRKIEIIQHNDRKQSRIYNGLYFQMSKRRPK
jgi:hypothetical protein